MADKEAEDTGQDTFKVYLRFRPCQDESTSSNEPKHTREIEKGCSQVFDGVFGVGASQTNVYNTCIAPLVDDFLYGKSCNVFLYGESGSGKTFTLLGDSPSTQFPDYNKLDQVAENSSISPSEYTGDEEKAAVLDDIDEWQSNLSNAGILPRIIHHVFEAQQLKDGDSNLRIKCSFIIIYQEKIVDLLANPNSSKRKPRAKRNSLKFLKLKEDDIDGVVERPCSTEKDVLNLIHCGIKRQNILKTHYGAVSSWSNSLFTIKLERQESTSEPKPLSCMHLVDLADSTLPSKLKKSKSDKERKLRKAYSAVSNMIISKVDPSKGISQQDSKLTRLLYPKMEHPSNNILFLCVSPSQKRLRRTKESIALGLVVKKVKGIPPRNGSGNDNDRLHHEISEENIDTLKPMCSDDVEDGGCHVNGQDTGKDKLLRSTEESDVKDRAEGIPIEVYLRLRPLNKFDESRRCHRCITVDDSGRNVTIDSPINTQMSIGFDHVFDVGTSSDDIYQRLGVNYVPDMLERSCNNAIITYGVSKTGKTKTLFGETLVGQHATDNDDQIETYEKEENIIQDSGLCCRIVNDLFMRISELKKDGLSEFTVRMSFVSILLETTWDLLREHTSRDFSDTEVMDDKSFTQASCCNTTNVLVFMKQGLKNLYTICKRMNIDSDQGHLFMTLNIEKKNIRSEIEKTTLQIVRLGGYQSNPMPFQPKMIQQMHNSHKAFKAIIKAAVKRNKKLPYDKSKVTSLLRDAIGGKCKTVVIVTASASTHNISETIQCILLGQSIRKVVNHPDSNPHLTHDGTNELGQEMQVKFNDQEVKDMKNQFLIFQMKNKRLIEEKKKIVAEIDCYKRNELQHDITDLDMKHKLVNMEYKLKSSSVYLQHLRKLHWKLQLEVANKSSEEYKSDLAEFFSQYPDISGITDFDDILLDAGMIEDVERNEGVLEKDVEVLLEEGQSLKITPSDTKVNELLDLEDLSESVDSKGNGDGSAIDPLTPRERQLMQELRAMSSRNRDLQNRLDIEKANVNTLKNGNSIIFQSRLVHEILVLREEHELYVKNSRVAAWKIHEVDSVNKALREKLHVTQNHLQLLEDAFQNLQASYCSSVIETQNLMDKLRESK